MFIKKTRFPRKKNSHHFSISLILLSAKNFYFVIDEMQKLPAFYYFCDPVKRSL